MYPSPQYNLKFTKKSGHENHFGLLFRLDILQELDHS